MSQLADLVQVVSTTNLNSAEKVQLLLDVAGALEWSLRFTLEVPTLEDGRTDWIKLDLEERKEAERLLDES